MKNGYFIISLDFELYWGMFDKIRKEDYEENLLGVRIVLPKILEIFEYNGIHATWAIVGKLFFENRIDLLENIPQRIPDYKNKELSSYRHIAEVGENEIDDPFHYGASLINLIKETEFQEVGSHTFSHYYCLEEGQTEEDFIEDLKAFNKISDGLGVSSIVFPRNQVNEEYLGSCASYGIKTYRGTLKRKIYSSGSDREINGMGTRILRLMDSYINIYGHNTYSVEDIEFKNEMVNLPASRFLRPYNKRLRFMEKMKLKRILNDMTYAAINKEVYHLWWHPHNSGNNIKQNLRQIETIALHYKYLNEKYNWESTSMKKLAAIIFDSKQWTDSKFKTHI